MKNVLIVGSPMDSHLRGRNKLACMLDEANFRLEIPKPKIDIKAELSLRPVKAKKPARVFTNIDLMRIRRAQQKRDRKLK